jgi:hypothetical protein
MANWYLDASVGSSGSGTLLSPWKASSNVVWGASGVKAGDTLYVAAGTYAPLTVGASGTSDVNRLVIQARQDSNTGPAIFSGGNAGPAIIFGNKTGTARNYITIDGNYVGSRQFTFRDGTQSGDSFKPIIDAQTAIGSIIRYADIRHGMMGINNHSATNGTNPVIEVDHCYFTDIFAESAIDMATGVSTPTFGLRKIHHNEFYFPVWLLGGDEYKIRGIDCIQGESGIDSYNNTFHAYWETAYNTYDGQHPDCHQIQRGYNRIYNNLFYDCGDSFIDLSMLWDGLMDHLWVYNNVFTMTNTLGYSIPWQIRCYNDLGWAVTSQNDFLMCNNTFVDCYDFMSCLRFYSQGGGAYNPIIQNTRIQNNLFYNSGGAGYWGLVAGVAGSNFTAAQYNFDYNLVTAGPDGSDCVVLDQGTGSESQIGLPRYTQSHPRTGTPQFVSYTKRGGPSNDFHLASGDTAAKGQGVDLSAYFTTDKDGTTRTGAWSIGAYQGAGAAPPVGTPVLSVR